VTFDPFGDFKTRGYLRNIEGEKDLDIVRRLEHTSFVTGIEEAFQNLSQIESLSYEHVLETLKILFEAVYPWAGQDRVVTAPNLAISKGPVLFAYPHDIRRAIEHALQKGQNTTFMASKPGYVMGYLAYGHPFLDGNGRTIMVVHSVLAHRAGFSIDWAATSKTDYLSALTNELDDPGAGHLDAYLKPFITPAVAANLLAAGVSAAPGLDGNAELNTVLGKVSDPELQERYQEQELRRKSAEQ
jgi:cell filamentation protein